MASEAFFAKLDRTERSIINIDFMVTAHEEGLKILQAGKSAYMVELTVMKELASLKKLLAMLKQEYMDKGKNPDVLIADYMLDDIGAYEMGAYDGM